MQSHLLIGAASSGSGKTTFTLGLLRALKKRNFRIQPFKCGPDYIDTRHHCMAAGCSSVNLDRFMMSDNHIRDLYRRYTQEADVAVTEGVMGLFDGYAGMQGSSAEIARLLDIPVLLVVNAKSTAYSVAPLLYGFRNFDKRIRVIGVVFNFVASESHYTFLKEACRDAGVEALGYLPKQADIEIPSRHLGLSLDEDFCFNRFADRIAGLVEKYVDINRLMALTGIPSESLFFESSEVIPEKERKTEISGLQIAVARDAAFNFVYEENLQFLRQVGKVVYFSPLSDSEIPEADLVYLPGGYPELYLPGLSANRTMLHSLYNYVEGGGRLLAECGGMMYVCRSVTGTDGVSYPMVGIFPQSATMNGMKLKLGYREIHYGTYILKGHEFHYSSITPSDPSVPSAGIAFTARGKEVDTPLYRYKNALAGYTHLYWGDPDGNEWFRHFIGL